MGSFGRKRGVLFIEGVGHLPERGLAPPLPSSFSRPILPSMERTSFSHPLVVDSVEIPGSGRIGMTL